MPGSRLAGQDDFFCGLIDRLAEHAYQFEVRESSSAAENRPNVVCEKITRRLLDRKQSVHRVSIMEEGIGNRMNSKF
jgi:hypothetical protein